MAQVAKLTSGMNTVKSRGFTRCQDLDFSDDGSRFTGWMWCDVVPLTQCVYGGKTYLCVCDDYMRSSAKIPHHFWEKYEESKLGDEYNGTSEKIDLDELANICRKIQDGIKRAKADFEAEPYPDLSNRIQRFVEGTEKAKDVLSRNLNWFEMNLSPSGIKKAHETYNDLKKALKKDQAEIDGMINKTIPKERAYDSVVYNDKALSEYYANKLNELIDQKDYSWYYEVKSSSMR